MATTMHCKLAHYILTFIDSVGGQHLRFDPDIYNLDGSLSHIVSPNILALFTQRYKLCFETKSTIYKFGNFTTILHEHLSQNLGANGHFEELKVSKFQLDQKLQNKIQIFFNFER